MGETSFSAVLREAWLRAAAQLLSQQPLTARQVSLLVGYRQPAHFAKAFRRRWGVTPAQYPDRAWRVRTRQETMEDSSDESTKGLASLAWLSRCWRSD